MSKKLFYTTLLFFISFFSHSQGEANNWYFGYGAGLIFDNVNNTVTPSDAAQNSIATFEGCSSISDPAGNLLFYSDGRDVWFVNCENKIFTCISRFGDNNRGTCTGRVS